MTDNTQLATLARSRRPKKHAHWWISKQFFTSERYGHGVGGGTATVTDVCDLCGITRADYEARQRRGRNSKKRGGAAELSVARTYGGEKVGPLGLPEDIRGKLWRTQVKVSKRLAPPMWREEFRKMAAASDGRTPRLILRFATQGVKAEDFVVVRGEDWLSWFGRDE